jgi:hypothetical protein
MDRLYQCNDCELDRADNEPSLSNLDREEDGRKVIGGTLNSATKKALRLSTVWLMRQRFGGEGTSRRRYEQCRRLSRSKGEGPLDRATYLRGRYLTLRAVFRAGS